MSKKQFLIIGDFNFEDALEAILMNQKTVDQEDPILYKDGTTHYQKGSGVSPSDDICEFFVDRNDVSSVVSGYASEDELRNINKGLDWAFPRETWGHEMPKAEAFKYVFDCLKGKNLNTSTPEECYESLDRHNGGLSRNHPSNN